MLQQINSQTNINLLTDNYTDTLSVNQKGKQTRATTDNQLIYLWLAGKAKTTVSNYTSTLNSFRKLITTPLNVIVFDDLIMYQDYLRIKKGLKPNSIANHLACLKSLFKFAHEIGYLRVNVAKAVTVKKSDTIHERLMQPDDAKKLIDAINKPKDRLMITLMFRLGLRVSEVGQLKWDNLRGNILSVTGKGNKTRHLIVPDDVLEELVKLKHQKNTFIFENRNGKGYDRRRIHEKVKKYAKKAGIDSKVSSHWLRHCFATTALKNSKNVKLVSVALGHSSIHTTDKYLHVNPDECATLFV